MLTDWLDSNSLDHELHTDPILNKTLVLIDTITYLFLEPDESLLFDEDFNFILSRDDHKCIQKHSIEHVIFSFGGLYYYSSLLTVQLNLLKYLGKATLTFHEDVIPHLGVHGGFELFNGTRSYIDWCKKAKFLGIESLGICERDTLAGTLQFQEACKQYSIKPIIGEEFLFEHEGETALIKFYCKSQRGWRNLLNIHNKKSVQESRVLNKELIQERLDGLVCLVYTKSDTILKLLQKLFKHSSDDLYFQFHTTVWKSSEKDDEHINTLQHFYNNWKSKIKPALVNDSYYLDVEEHDIKTILNSTGNAGYQYQSTNQFFKDIDTVAEEILTLGPEESIEQAYEFLQTLITNTRELADKCSFVIETSGFKLPQYPLTESESSLYKNQTDLFISLVQDGLVSKIDGQVEDNEPYLIRAKEEIEVISEGGFIDYFLIIRDILNWCEKHDILTGTGRGSVGGSLVAYLLGITKIDPIKYGLLFERFLNKGRIKTSLPDIDSDITDVERPRVKKYIEERYGVDNVASIGTYSTLKIKAVLKELSRYYNIPPATINYYTAMIPDDASIEQFFKEASQNLKLKEFVQKNTALINNIYKCFKQPKNASIHAAGLIITPRIINQEEVTIYDLMPIKKDKDGLIITEWEGEYTEKMGFLKADFLGLKQLGKFSQIKHLVKKDLQKDIDLQSIDLADDRVYERFKKGLNEDVFQFGAQGLKAYCTSLKPETIDDLIAVIALYRPGPIEIRAHLDYVKIKHGLMRPSYDFMCREITEDTNSLLIYQEQIMKVCQLVGGFTLVEADDIRKAMGKSKMDVMLSYKERFISGAVKQGCKPQDAQSLWDKMVGFANYCFNKSHSVAYALTGYQSQWLKVHYPLQFWTVSLRESSKDEIPFRIHEIKQSSDIQVLPPDINRSEKLFTSSIHSNAIYWSIDSISHAGEVAVNAIIEERQKEGKFFSFQDFVARMGKKINKRVVSHLILSGCFDEIENVTKYTDRLKLIQQHLGENTLPANFDPKAIWKDYYWVLKQRELCGFGYLDYKHMFSKTKLKNNNTFIEASTIGYEESEGYNKVVIGIATQIIVRPSVRGEFAQLILNQNDIPIYCIVWSKLWPDLKPMISDSENKIVAISGQIKFDKHKQCNVLQTNDDTQFHIF